MNDHDLKLTINGRPVFGKVEARLSLADFLRTDVGCTGVHVGCEHGVCGACTVIVDGHAIRSCLMFAVQANGAYVMTVEGLATPDGALHPVQQALRDEHALQCGFCTPGIAMTMAAVLQADSATTESALLDAVSGHICRCTGYQGIRRAARRLANAGGGQP